MIFEYSNSVSLLIIVEAWIIGKFMYGYLQWRQSLKKPGEDRPPSGEVGSIPPV